MWHTTLFFLPFIILNRYAGHARAQLIGGQFFTSGLVIVDSPQPGSSVQAGGNLNLALDVSADGLIPLSSIQSTTSPTAIQSLNLFLISEQQGINISLSTGSGLLLQESGSTVKHLNFGLPGCLPAGEYDIALHEFSLINSSPYYSITLLPLSLSSSSPSSSTTCAGSTKPQNLPQVDSKCLPQPLVGNGRSAFVLDTTGVRNRLNGENGSSGGTSQPPQAQSQPQQPQSPKAQPQPVSQGSPAQSQAQIATTSTPPNTNNNLNNNSPTNPSPSNAAPSPALVAGEVQSRELSASLNPLPTAISSAAVIPFGAIATSDNSTTTSLGGSSSGSATSVTNVTVIDAPFGAEPSTITIGTSSASNTVVSGFATVTSILTSTSFAPLTLTTTNPDGSIQTLTTSTPVLYTQSITSLVPTMITTSFVPTSTAGADGSGGFGVFGVQVVVDSAAVKQTRSGASGNLKGWIWGVGVMLGVELMM